MYQFIICISLFLAERVSDKDNHACGRGIGWCRPKCFQESTWTGMTPYCVGRITAVCLGGEGEAEEDPKENKGAGEEVNIKVREEQLIK